MPKRTQIPFPGGSGPTPTGALQFENDWPGLFIRGDSAISVMLAIRRLQERLADTKDLVVISAIITLGKIADTIEQDVIVRSEEPLNQ